MRLDDVPVSPHHIVVPQWAFHEPLPSSLALANVRFVNAMVDEGGYLMSELPPNALRSYYVDYYCAQVHNGGLGLFVGNSGWKPETIENCITGLEAMGLHKHLRLFRSLKSLLESDPERAQQIADGRGFGDIDPGVSKLDDKFFELDADGEIQAANSKWLRGLDELRVVRDAEYEDILEGLYAHNAQREARLAARQRAALQGKLQDSLQAGARLMCWEAWNVPVREVAGGAFGRSAPDGRRTIAWRIHTETGCHHVFVLPDCLYLCDLYLPDGTKFSAEILEESRRSLSGDGPLNLPSPDPDREVEVLKIDESMVAGAIGASKNLPVSSAAYLLCAAIEPSEDLVDSGPILDQTRKFKTWSVVTGEGVRLMSFDDAGAQLTTKTGDPLARVTNAEIEELVKADEDLEF